MTKKNEQKATVRLSLFREDPDNVSEATDEEIRRLAGKLKRVPMGLTAMRIAYVTDAPGGGCMVISGNKRLRCLKAAYGEDGEVPAEWFQDVTSMSEAERHEFRLNANVSDGHFNLDKLLAQYGAEELTEAGLAELLESVPEEEKQGEADPDDVPDVADDEPPKSKRGEIYQLGNHRLMCGDATNSLDFAKLMGGGLADMVFTDPPYGVAIGDKNKALNEVQKAGRCTTNIANDTLSTEELYNLLKAAFINTRQSCADDACYFVTSPQGGSLGLMMMMMMKDAGLEVRHVLMWRKNSPTFSLGRLDYDYQHEPIFYTWIKSHHNHRKGEHRTTIWDYDKPRKCDLHPTMKPVALVKNAILDGTLEGNTVLDPFGGSGTTLIACEQLGRNCRMMELDPHYCDTIIARWEKFTGKKAIKL